MVNQHLKIGQWISAIGLGAVLIFSAVQPTAASDIYIPIISQNEPAPGAAYTPNYTRLMYHLKK